MPKKKTGRKKKTKSTKKKKTTAVASSVTSKPKFPYTTKPNSLRKFFELIPDKPKPPKVNAETLRAWELRDTNDQTIIRVLKSLDFVDSSNQPTNKYVEFMSRENGPAVLASAIRDVWAPLFDHSHEPHRENDQTLRNYFNIHSGGGDQAMSFQVQTFKAACDHADFSKTTTKTPSTLTSTTPASETRTPQPAGSAIHIDLHIHLPENKSRRDYEYIFEDIARYIFGRDTESKESDKP